MREPGLGITLRGSEKGRQREGAREREEKKEQDQGRVRGKVRTYINSKERENERGSTDDLSQVTYSFHFHTLINYSKTQLLPSYSLSLSNCSKTYFSFKTN